MRLKSITILTINIIIIFIVTTQLKGESPKRIAILGFKTSSIPDSYGKIARNKLELVLYEIENFNLLETGTFESIIKEKNPELRNCGEAECAIKIGSFIKADYIITGSIKKSEMYVIIIRAIDVILGKTIFEATKTYENENKTSKVVNDIGQQLKDSINKMEAGKKFKPINDISSSYYLSVKHGYSFPIWDWNTTLLASNLSITIKAGMNNIFINNLLLTAEFDHQIFSSRENRFVTLENSVIVTSILLSACYYIKIYNYFFLLPSFSYGISLTEFEGFIDQPNWNSTDQTLKASLYFGFRFNKIWDIHLGISYQNIFTSNKNLQLLNFSTGVGATF
ncbi:MAG: hypothetical protein GY754_06510 [bacterium]|nr:hypothetical protein [bacterium]